MASPAKADTGTAGLGPDSVVYEQTLMYGRYTKDLGEYAKRAAATARQRQLDKQLEEVPSGWRSYAENTCCQKMKGGCIWVRDVIFAKIGEEWIFLTMLGVIMALLSFIMDYIIEKCQEARVWLHYELQVSPGLQYVAWVSYTVMFIFFSTGFTHIVAPQAIGSGIPEMKTILRGVVLKEYLTFRTLVSKMVGLCTSLGSGLPIGKEGPFVHIASIVATLLGKLTSFRGIYENESRNAEMLAAACAVGVACTFAAPIGGVLFSIEVTATYFAVRNYWRGFFSAVCGAVVFRLLAIWFKDEETITALFRTNLRQTFAFDPVELLAFSFIGVVCGFGGALFVFMHRKIIEFVRKHKKMSAFLQKNRFLYPGIVTFLISSLTFPLGLGQFFGGELTSRAAVEQLFSNITWAIGQGDNVADEKILRNWNHPSTNIYVTLSLFVLMRFWMSAMATSLPVPAGNFMPVFTIGAGFGRLIGESMATWFPNGVRAGGHLYMVVPGGYAVVGAAAFAGSVTHTISTSVIVFELTGQIAHVLPCVIAVLIANAISHALQPSIYESIIQIKRLPYLPDIVKAQAHAHRIFVEDFMIRDLKYLMMSSTYQDLKNLLTKTDLRSFPLVDAKDSMILLGSIQRYELQAQIEKQIGRERKLMPINPSEAPSIEVVDTETTNNANNANNASNGHSSTAPVNKDQVNIQVHDPSIALTPTTLGSVNADPMPEQNHQQRTLMKGPNGKKSRSRSPSPVNRYREKGGHLAVGKDISPLSSAKNTPEPSPRSSPKIPKRLSLASIFGGNKNETPAPLPGEPQRVIDMPPEDQFRWEMEQLQVPVNFEDCKIDPAPFQLVERTSLYKVHSLFSLLGLHHAYVTNTGRLVGVVALREVTDAISKLGEMSVSSLRASFKVKVQGKTSHPRGNPADPQS